MGKIIRTIVIEYDITEVTNQKGRYVIWKRYYNKEERGCELLVNKRFNCPRKAELFVHKWQETFSKKYKKAHSKRKKKEVSNECMEKDRSRTESRRRK